MKCIRSIRRWAYENLGNDRAIQLVAMVTPDDMKANAEYVRLADEVVPVPGTVPRSIHPAFRFPRWKFSLTFPCVLAIPLT